MNRGDGSFEGGESQESRVRREWNALSPEEREARILDFKLRVLARWQWLADDALKSFGGRDRPLYGQGPRGEQEIVAGSAIGFYRQLKGGFVEATRRLRNGEPLLIE